MRTTQQKARQITEPGLYQMPLEEYVADPAPSPSLNAGTAHRLITESPRHAWTHHPRLNPAYDSDESSRLDLGTIAHALLLEDDFSRVEVIEADDWRTKAAREQRDAARVAGRIPLLPKDVAAVKAMVKVAIDAIYSSEICEAWMEAIPEQTLLWQEEGVWCRSRPDKLTKDGRFYFDYKTNAGSAHPMIFGRGPLIKQGYDLQAVLGLRGIRHLLKPNNTKMIFVVQETEPPYAVSLVSLSPMFLATADERLALALDEWKRCLSAIHWPAYPNRICYVEPPSYYGMDTLPEEP